MLQVNVMPYASDALEDAMGLAQVKSLNSFTFSDCLNYLNYAWSDIYNRVACIDEGFYAQTVRLTGKFTTLPKYVANSVMVYRAQSPAGFNRHVYRASGVEDLNVEGTYALKGFELYVPDADRHTVWLQYVPSCPQLFFTHHNRDPKTYDVDSDYDKETVKPYYNLWKLQWTDAELNDWYDIGTEVTTEVTREDEEGNIVTEDVRQTYTESVQFRLLSRQDGTTEIPLTDVLHRDGMVVDYISCDYPYIFVTWKSLLDPGDYAPVHESGMFDTGILKAGDEGFDASKCFYVYNPYAFTGRESNVKYLKCSWNDKTGMGVVVRNYGKDDGTYTVEELGFTPDTLLQYPSPVMYRYLVARLADKFSAMNESNVMGVQKELMEAQYAFEAFLQKDKAGWQRIRNVNPPTWDDYL